MNATEVVANRVLVRPGSRAKDCPNIFTMGSDTPYPVHAAWRVIVNGRRTDVWVVSSTVGKTIISRPGPLEMFASLTCWHAGSRPGNLVRELYPVNERLRKALGL